MNIKEVCVYFDSISKCCLIVQGTVQSLFHNMPGSKQNGATTFLNLYTTESTLVVK